jgi:dihydroorotase
MPYDYLLKNAHLIDPLNGIDSPNDVAIANGKIAAVSPDIPSDQANRVIDLSGLYITPGLVDIHVHLYATPGHRNSWAGDNSILPDGFSFRTGTTTMMDTGSAGWRNFEDFRFRVIDRCKTRVFALVNIVGMGMQTNEIEQNTFDMDPAKTGDMARENADVVVGVKTAHYFGPDWTSVDQTIAAGDHADMPVMVDFGFFKKERPYYQLVGEKMRPGDISTHMYRASVPWLDNDGNLLDYLREARKRGIIFDVGHGGGSFVFRNAVPAIAQGFLPDSISTDLHTGSMNDAMVDMTTVMSKFLAIGMSLFDVVRTSTCEPARIIGHPELGHLTVGAIADIAVLNLMDGSFGYQDVADGKLDAEKRLACEMTFKDGRVVYDWNARMGTDYRKMGPTYGLRDIDHLVLPPSSEERST